MRVRRNADSFTSRLFVFAQIVFRVHVNWNSGPKMNSSIRPNIENSSTLLLADDNPDLLATLVEMLQAKYHIAGALGNGTSVLDQVLTLRPDLVLLDVSLGDLTGFEVARRLRTSGCTAKIIFLTVHEDVEFENAAFDMGASGYVFKSRISSDLVDAINRAVEGGRFSSAELPLAQ